MCLHEIRNPKFKWNFSTTINLLDLIFFIQSRSVSVFQSWTSMWEILSLQRPQMFRLFLELNSSPLKFSQFFFRFSWNKFFIIFFPAIDENSSINNHTWNFRQPRALPSGGNLNNCETVKNPFFCLFAGASWKSLNFRLVIARRF